MINFNAEFRLPFVIERRLAKFLFTTKVRERCWRKLASHQRHRMPLDESLKLFAKQARVNKSPVEHCYTEIRNRLAFGKNIGEALSGFASPEEVLLIHSSQKGGNFTEGLTLAAELLAARRKIITALVGALTYPAMLSGILVLFLYIISAVVMPQMAASTDPEHWQGSAAWLYRISLFVNSSTGVLAFLLFIGFIISIIATLPRWTGRGRAWADKIPPWSIYRLLIGVSWLQTVATLMSTGQKLVNILDYIIKDKNTTPYLRSILRKIFIYASRGANLGDVLESTKLNWPDRMIISELQSYANFPGFSKQIRSIATDWLDEDIDLIIQMSKIMNTLCILALGSLIIFIAVSIGSIQQNMIQGMGM